MFLNALLNQAFVVLGFSLSLITLVSKFNPVFIIYLKKTNPLIFRILLKSHSQCKL